MKKLIVFLTFVFCFPIINYSQNFFPLKIGNKYQVKIERSSSSNGIWDSSTRYSKFIITDTLRKEGLLFHKYLNSYIHYHYNDSTNRLYTIDNQQNIVEAVKFNSNDGDSVSIKFNNWGGGWL